MNESTRTSGVALSWVLALAAAGAAESAVPEDKSQFHLFNPTPPRLLRAMSTDRPDKTESPYTVDAGHFQLEVDAVNYTSDKERERGVSHRLEAWAVAPVNLKVGLWNRADLQLVLETYNYVRERAGGVRVTRRGFGDITARFKCNFWGNDGGRTAFAAMPYVKFPTSQDGLGNDRVEGGLILPVAFELPKEFDLGVMTQFDFARDGDDAGWHAQFVNTITVSRDLVGKLGGYVEFFSQVSAERDSRWVGTFDMGFTYAVSGNIQLDAGVNIGVTRAADDWNPFLGLSWRF
jgi:hypothetical protein